MLATGDIHVVPLKRGLARRACRRRPTRSWPPAARCWPASTPAPRWRGSSSGPGCGVAVPPDDPAAFLAGAAASCSPSPDRGAPMGAAGRAFVERGRRRRPWPRPTRSCSRSFGGARRSPRSGPPGSLAPSWVRHRRRRRSPGSRKPGKGAQGPLRAGSGVLPSRIAVVVVLGLALIVFARQSGNENAGRQPADADATTGTRPSASTSATSFLPPMARCQADPLGIHTHGDGADPHPPVQLRGHAARTPSWACSSTPPASRCRTASSSCPTTVAPTRRATTARTARPPTACAWPSGTTRRAPAAPTSIYTTDFGNIRFTANGRRLHHRLRPRRRRHHRPEQPAAVGRPAGRPRSTSPTRATRCRAARPSRRHDRARRDDGAGRRPRCRRRHRPPHHDGGPTPGDRPPRG